MTTVGGLVVGLLTQWLGSAGEIAAVVDNIHFHNEPSLDLMTVVWGLSFGVLGAGVAGVFAAAQSAAATRSNPLPSIWS